MTPSMARDLVALRVHSLDDGWVYGAWVVNLPLAVVDGGNEEGRFGVIRF